MNRRHFITLLGGMMAANAVAANKPQPERMRRIAILAPGVPGDVELKALPTALWEQWENWVGQKGKIYGPILAGTPPISIARAVARRKLLTRRRM
jgi:hypothetical protein